MEEQSHWASFGDGNAAQILETREYASEILGTSMIKFIFIPSKRIEQLYDIVDEQDVNGAIVREYSKHDVVFLERGVNRTRCWIYTDFNGGETPASRRFRELTETLEDTERLFHSAEAAKNRAYQELEMERTQQMQAIETKSKMVKIVAKARGRVDGEGDDSMSDNND